MVAAGDKDHVPLLGKLQCLAVLVPVAQAIQLNRMNPASVIAEELFTV